MTLTPAEKLKLAHQVTAMLDAALEGEVLSERTGAEILVLALKSRVPMEQLRTTFAGNSALSASDSYSSL